MQNKEYSAENKVGGRKNRRRLAFGCLGLFLLPAFCTMIFQGADPKKNEAIKQGTGVVADNRLANADDQIAQVEAFQATKHGRVKIELAQMWSDNQLMSHVAMVVEAAGKAMKAGAPDMPVSIETVTFWVTVPTTDAYGKDGRSKAVEFTVKAADLRQIEYGKIEPQSLLNFAYDVEVRPMARAGVAEFCREFGATAGGFCAEAR